LALPPGELWRAIHALIFVMEGTNVQPCSCCCSASWRCSSCLYESGLWTCCVYVCTCMHHVCACVCVLLLLLSLLALQLLSVCEWFVDVLRICVHVHASRVCALLRLLVLCLPVFFVHVSKRVRMCMCVCALLSLLVFCHFSPVFCVHVSKCV